MTPETLALLAEIAAANEAITAPTGEPCRCPETVLNCICGAEQPVNREVA